MEQLQQASRMTSRYAKKRDAILHEAARLFNQQGVKGTTLSDVAAQVGLSTNSITYYYKKKEALVVACLLRSVAVINDIITEAGQSKEPKLRVRGFIHLFFDHLAKIRVEQCPEMMTFRDIQVLGSPHAEEVYAAYTQMFRRIRVLLVTGPIRPDERISVNARSHLLLALMLGAMTWTDRYDPADYGRAAEAMSDILLEGLAGQASVWRVNDLDRQLINASDTPESTQESFLRAATALINEQGYRGASVERISARLNVTKGSFYYHNPNKEDLISACFERTFSAIRKLQEIALEGEGSGWDKLTAVSRALVRYQFSEHGPLIRMSAWSELPEEIRERKLATINRLGQRFVGFLVDGMKDGSIRPLDQSIAASLVNSMINAAVVLDRWVPDVMAEDAIELFARPFFMGILLD